MLRTGHHHPSDQSSEGGFAPLPNLPLSVAPAKPALEAEHQMGDGSPSSAAAATADLLSRSADATHRPPPSVRSILGGGLRPPSEPPPFGCAGKAGARSGTPDGRRLAQLRGRGNRRPSEPFRGCYAPATTIRPIRSVGAAVRSLNVRSRPTPSTDFHMSRRFPAI